MLGCILDIATGLASLSELRIVDCFLITKFRGHICSDLAHLRHLTDLVVSALLL